MPRPSAGVTPCLGLMVVGALLATSCGGEEPTSAAETTPVGAEAAPAGMASMDGAMAAAPPLHISKAVLDQHRQALERDPRDFVANPDGAITMVEFLDYRCGKCKVASPEVLALIEQNPDVRVVFKDYPYWGETSRLAAAVMATPQVRPKALELHRRLMAEPLLDEAAITRHLEEVGLDASAVLAAARAEPAQQHVRDVEQLAAQLGLQATPVFIVGDTVVQGYDLQPVREAIAKARIEGPAAS